ncbi:glutamate 5-kinase [Maridesulfovibrio ferrireducens]|uniref:Glutamate 5-kinase n=1 Tax=Maridesulfovibrio ferrireducens TaxID=246191 RepID=A0A1G9FZM1_9BACT|nr:glutamate 5-kinase [Maridesulfovibrio ferrireducens]SDK93777.1 glutamate 5-kinase [Maridesulfovibrio ferrireducens]
MSKMSNRLETLREAKRIVVKIGSAVLTTSEGINLGLICRLADQLATLHERGVDIVLVSSGAVAAGRKSIPSGQKLRDLPARQAASSIGQSRLMHEYDETFRRFGLVSSQILLTRDDLRHRDRFLNVRNTLSRLLEWRVIPIINENDTVAVQELEFGDNDTLASLILNVVEADLFINLTSADGVFDKNPDQNPDAKKLSHVENIGSLDLDAMCDGKTAVGSGGMFSKMRAAHRAAQLGVPTLILSGKDRMVIERVFNGEDCGTWIVPDEKCVSGRKFWLAYNCDPAGDLIIDEGAQKALMAGGKSLLPAGITAVEGDFKAGELVRVVSKSGKPVAVGLACYGSEDMNKILGHKSDQIESILGKCPFPEAIHRDNLLLDAAL